MKKLVVAAMLVSGLAYAEEKAPKPFQNSDIKRTLEDGKVQKFDGDKYMIVRRGKKKKPKAKVVAKPCPKCEKPEIRRNRVGLLLGRGASGDLNQEGNRVFTEHEPMMGLQYQRLLNDRISIGVQVQTNETFSGSVGVDF